MLYAGMKALAIVVLVLAIMNMVADKWYKDDLKMLVLIVFIVLLPMTIFLY